MKRRLQPNRALQKLALLIAVNCVRNTVIQDYHRAGRLSDPEMKAFNQDVANRLFTALAIFYDPRFRHERDAFFDFLNRSYPNEWDMPLFDWTMVGPETRRRYGILTPKGFDDEFFGWTSQSHSPEPVGEQSKSES